MITKVITRSPRTNTMSNFINNYGSESMLLGGTIALSAVIGGFAFWAGNQQDMGIKASLTNEGTAHIPGFQEVKADGNMFNFNEGSLHNATVRLSSGLECCIQFTPQSDGSIWSEIGPNHAKVVSYGTCPTDIPGIK